MARPRRLEAPGVVYHVVVRGNERRAVFRDDSDRARYLARLVHYREKFGFRLLAFCLMDNHVHLAVEAGRHPLSRIMAGVQFTYTQYFNRRHGRVGHLFQGRYKAFLIEKGRYALALLRYVHENPVKAGIVARPEQYRWSSDRSYRRGKGPEWVDLDRLLAMLGNRRSDAIRGYRVLMRESLAEAYEDVASWGQAVKGDEQFANIAFEKIGEPKVRRRGLTVEAVAQAVAKQYGFGIERMRSTSQSRGEALGRALVAWAGREVGGISIARAAKFFGRDTSSMARRVARLEEQMSAERGLRRSGQDLTEGLRSRQ